MGYATILGLDLGKFKSVCCVMDAGSGRHAFETLASLPATIADLLTRHAAAANGEEILLVIETCDVAGWVHDVACATPGVAVTVVHTKRDEWWKWHKVKRKTDRDDALKLARLARLGELPQPPVHVPSPRRRTRDAVNEAAGPVFVWVNDGSPREQRRDDHRIVV